MEAIKAIQDLAQAKDNDGEAKQAYHLYIKAVSLICDKLQGSKIADESITTEYTLECFAIARQCLQSAEIIKNSSESTNNQSNTSTPISSNAKSPPPIPPKPKILMRKPVNPKILTRKPVNPTLLSDLRVDHSHKQIWRMKNEEATPVSPLKLTIPKFQATNPDATPEILPKFQESPDILPSSDSAKYENADTLRKTLPMPPAQGSVASLRRKLDTVIYRRASSPNLGTPSPQSPAFGSRRGSSIKGMLSLPHLSRGDNRSAEKCSVPSSPNLGWPKDGSATSFFHFDNSIDLSQMMTAPILQDDNLAIPGTQKGSDNVPRIPVPPLQIVYRQFQNQDGTPASRPDKVRSMKIVPECKVPEPLYKPPTAETVTEHKAIVSQLHTLHVSAAMIQSMLQFPPHLLAYQITLIDSSIFRAIQTDALIEHSPKSPHPNIVASTDFFNYLTRVIEHCILLPQEASVRAQHVNHWIKIASKCQELRNFQTLKAIVSSLGTPPIQRLKRTWSFVPKKSMTRLEVLNNLMSESCNYRRYREQLGTITDSDQKATERIGISKPIVPFLGTFIHDVTYIIAFIKSFRGPTPHTSVSTPTARVKSKPAVEPRIGPLAQQSDISAAEKLMLKQDQRFVELVRTFEQYQNCPDYLPTLPHQFVKSLHKSPRTRFSDALKSASSNKLGLQSSEDDRDDMPLTVQQTIITQYLLTRPWVTEKVIDELSMIREPSQKLRSNSESSSQLTSSINSNRTNMSVSSASSIITCKSNSIGGFRSSSGSYDSDNPCTSGDDPIPTQERCQGCAANKTIDASICNERKDSKNLWSFTWRRGSVDGSGNAPDGTTSLPTATVMELQEPGQVGRPKIWTDEYWQGNKNDGLGIAPVPKNGIATSNENRMDAVTPGINLLQSHHSINMKLPKPHYQWSHSEVAAGSSWSYNRKGDDIRPSVLMMEKLAPWQPVEEPEPL